IADIHRREGESSPLQALWWAADRFRRLALQPLDFCPPVDIQFADYGRAVLKNFLLYEEHESSNGRAYLDLIQDVFHRRLICSHKRASCSADPRQCAVMPGHTPRMEIMHDINRIARSRAAAYYFLNDNRPQLHIPPEQAFEVVDLYATITHGAAAVRLLCGGTLVLDGQGNVLAWENKPGAGGVYDVQAGRARRDALLAHIARQARYALQREAPEAVVPGPWNPPVVANIEDGVLRLEIPP